MSISLPQWRKGRGCTLDARATDDYCRPCRSVGHAYDAWRKANAGAANFDCPHGLKMGERLPMRGLGDAVERVAESVGIKSCGGCKRRRDKLNKLVPFKEAK